MKTILVPTDFSALAHDALSVALSLAKTYSSDIILLHTVAYPVAPPVFGQHLPMMENLIELNQEQADDDRTRLETLTKEAAASGVTITPKLVANDAGLAESITATPVDLIVMASSGASGLEEWLVGSNAEVVIRNAHCPVLVIKKPVADFAPNKVVYAIDVDDALKTPQTYPFRIGQPQAAQQLLYVLTPTDNHDPDGVREWAAEFAKAQQLPTYNVEVRAAKTVPDGILQYADEVDADLLVVYTHARKGLLRLITGSVAEEVVNHADIPVLVMRT